MSTPNPTNRAAYLVGPQVKPLVVKDAPYTLPSAHESVVRNHAVAVNPVEWCKQWAGNMMVGWIKYPAVLEKRNGRKFVAMASLPFPETYPEGSGQTFGVVRALSSIIWWQLPMWIKSTLKGIPAKFFIGDMLQYNEVRRLVYEDFLPQALAKGQYMAAPEPLLVGQGLEFIQAAFDVQKAGVSAKKVVVTL